MADWGADSSKRGPLGGPIFRGQRLALLAIGRALAIGVAMIVRIGEGAILFGARRSTALGDLRGCRVSFWL